MNVRYAGTTTWTGSATRTGARTARTRLAGTTYAAGAGAVASHHLFPIPFPWPRLLGLLGLAALLTVLGLLAPEALLPRLLLKLGLLAVFPVAVAGLGLAGVAPLRRLRDAVARGGGRAI